MRTMPLRGLPIWTDVGPMAHPDDLRTPCPCSEEHEELCRHNQSEDGCPIAAIKRAAGPQCVSMVEITGSSDCWLCGLPLAEHEGHVSCGLPSRPYRQKPEHRDISALCSCAAAQMTEEETIDVLAEVLARCGCG